MGGNQELLGQSPEPKRSGKGPPSDPDRVQSLLDGGLVGKNDLAVSRG